VHLEAKVTVYVGCFSRGDQGQGISSHTEGSAWECLPYNCLLDK